MIKNFEEFDINEAFGLPDKNYLEEDGLRRFWIPDTEQKLHKYETALNDIMNANRAGAYVQNDFLKIGDFVKCEWRNGAIKYGQVKEFACTFEGRIFPIMFECKKDMTPKKTIISATWLESDMLKITKWNN